MFADVAVKGEPVALVPLSLSPPKNLPVCKTLSATHLTSLKNCLLSCILRLSWIVIQSRYRPQS